MIEFCGNGLLLFLGEELGDGFVVIVLLVHLVEGGGNDISRDNENPLLVAAFYTPISSCSADVMGRVRNLVMAVWS